MNFISGLKKKSPILLLSAHWVPIVTILFFSKKDDCTERALNCIFYLRGTQSTNLPIIEEQEWFWVQMSIWNHMPLRTNYLNDFPFLFQKQSAGSPWLTTLWSYDRTSSPPQKNYLWSSSKYDRILGPWQLAHLYGVLSKNWHSHLSWESWKGQVALRFSTQGLLTVRNFAPWSSHHKKDDSNLPIFVYIP